MNFDKRLVISYLLTFLLGILTTIIPLINPYFFLTSIFALMVVLFYLLMTNNLVFTLIYVYLLFKKDKFDLPKIECFENNYFNFLCIFCDYYKECKKEKEKNDNF